VGKLDRPRRLYVEATVVSAPLFLDSTGQRVAWVRLDLLEQVYGPLGRVGFGFGQMVRTSSDPEARIEYRTLRTIVRGASLTLESAHGESLTLRDGTFTCTPALTKPQQIALLPTELQGKWPGSEQDPDRRLVRQARLRQGDVVRFEALFTPERHPRAGSSYRDDVEVRYRVDRGANPIEVELVGPEDR